MDKKLLLFMLWMLIALNGADISSTMYLMGRGLATEWNPLFKHIVPYPATAGFVKLGIVGACSYGLWIYHARYPRTVMLGVLGVVLSYLFVVIHNALLACNGWDKVCY